MKWFALVHSMFTPSSTKNHIAKAEAMGKNKKQLEKLLGKL